MVTAARIALPAISERAHSEQRSHTHSAMPRSGRRGEEGAAAAASAGNWHGKADAAAHQRAVRSFGGLVSRSSAADEACRKSVLELDR